MKEKFILAFLAVWVGALLGVVIEKHDSISRYEMYYYRGVWNTCLYGVAHQTTPERAKEVCAVAYWRAIDESWYTGTNWPDVPEGGK